MSQLTSTQFNLLGIKPTNPVGTVDQYQTPGVVPVIDVTLISSGARTTINASDYNPILHSNPSKARTPVNDFPGWELLPEGGGSIAIQVTMISGGALATIWSSAYNPSLHTNPEYMTNVQTSLGVTRLSQLTGLPYRGPTPGPFGQEVDLAGTTEAYATVSRALANWPSSWPLPSLNKSPVEVAGGTATLT